MSRKKFLQFVGDFETTVYEGQALTEVWASALVQLESEDVLIFHSIDETFNHLFELAKKNNLRIYYHNLKFDGTFILDYLLRVLGWEQAFNIEYDDAGDIKNASQIDTKQMKNKTFKYLISDLGQWYSITVKYKNHIIEFRDSVKLLPFSVAELGKAFDTKHKKLEMEYQGFRYAGCTITEAEKEYIKNDVLVVKEALELMFKEGHDKMTIGACCLSEWRKGYNKRDYNKLFPNLKDIKIDAAVFGSDNADDYIRKSYKGGWCYVVRGKENQVYRNGLTLDVNSLYPSMMHSESGNYYPVGEPTFWSGDYIPEEAKKGYYFIRIKTKFNIKPNKLPCIQIKNNLLYKPTDYLTSSDIVFNGRRFAKYEKAGKLYDTYVTLTLTQTDYELVKQHYNLIDCMIVDGCYFDKCIGLFDDYINKYKRIKMTSTGARKTLSKLYLNNLYGKVSSGDNSSFKVAYLREDESIGLTIIEQHEKDVVFIAIGSAITSYARNFTIRTAQQNYHGVNKAGFIYADTDSIHCDLPLEKIKGVRLSDNDFCCWKHESSWDEALFIRQKTYIEHVQDKKGGYYDIKCAGMTERCKQLFIASMTQVYNEDDYTAEELSFIKEAHGLESFETGLVIPTGKLVPRRIKGGTVLVDTSYEIR